MVYPYYKEKGYFVRRAVIFTAVFLVIIIATGIIAGTIYLRRRPDWRLDRVLVQKEIAKHPERGMLYYYLGRISIGQKRYNEAISYLEKALGKTLISEEKAVVYNELGNCYSIKDKTKNAVKCYHKSLIIRPDYAPAFDSLGRLYFSKRDFPRARSYFEMAVEIAPRSTSYNNNLAAAYLMLGDRESACRYWSASLKIDKKQPEIRNFLSEYEHNIGGKYD